MPPSVYRTRGKVCRGEVIRRGGTMDECEVLKMTDDEVVVQHRTKGHQSTFVIAHDADGRRQLPASGVVAGQEFASDEDSDMLWTFACREAHRAGKIDHLSTVLPWPFMVRVDRSRGRSWPTSC